MIIRKVQATFGKLHGDTLSFHGGLNVIYAPNESGKSTWCAFIRTMLFGMEPQKRTYDNCLPDKTRYLPWSGAPMEGTMEVTADKCDLTLTRTTISRSNPMSEFSAVYTGTNSPVEGMNGSNCGELLTGVNREVFRRSAFIEQGAVELTESSELENRIRKTISSGDENTSYTEASDRLRSWQKKRRNEKRGILPALENEIDDAQQLLTEMKSGIGALQDLERQLEETKQQCSLLENQVTEARRRQRIEALNNLRNGRVLVQQRRDSHDQALAEVSRSREALRRSEFGDRSGAELETEITSDRVRLQELDDGGMNRNASLLPAIVFSTLAILFAAFYGVSTQLFLILAAALCCLAAVVCFLRYSRLHQAQQETSTERDTILRKYKISVPDDLETVLNRHKLLETSIINAENEEIRSRERLENAEKQLLELEESAVSELDFAGGNTEAARLSRELLRKRNEASALAAKISGIHGRLSAMGDPLVLSSSILSMQEQHDTIQEEYDAITLAAELLREADTEIQGMFAPELSSLAAQYMSEMTGGRYQEILVSQDFSAKARTSDDTVAREAAYLSAGTMDLMYLAVRLAVCELALPAGEPCPLIIDDALVNLDNTRYEQAMTLLKKIALKRQIILFTCRRE